jgi:Phosphodiester glycosidase
MAARPQLNFEAVGASPTALDLRVRLADGAETSAYVAVHPLPDVDVRVVRLERPVPLAAWCREERVDDAIVGGFFTRPHGEPLGEVWIDGRRSPSVPFASPWDAIRCCLSVEAGRVALSPRGELPSRPTGDLLQAGPLLVRGGRVVVVDGRDPEGFSAGQAQFDSDITAGRYPRAALGVGAGAVLAVACDGRSDEDCGLTLEELGDLLLALGAHDAINLDGGGSTSLVRGGRLVNRPREEHGLDLAAGRPISTALVFARR